MLRKFHRIAWFWHLQDKMNQYVYIFTIFAPRVLKKLHIIICVDMELIYKLFYIENFEYFKKHIYHIILQLFKYVKWNILNDNSVL